MQFNDMQQVIHIYDKLVNFMLRSSLKSRQIYFMIPRVLQLPIFVSAFSLKISAC